jgi:two-component system nitrogen regulation response regulator GlnG
MGKLLLIDDEPVIQHAFRKAFHPPEYSTTTARTAAKGLEQFAADRPDVVVLDVHLPDADGLATFDRLKQVDARVPVILITGHGTTDLTIEAMKRGAFEYLLKPLLYDRLKAVVDQACASSRLMNVPAVMADTGRTPDRADALVGRCPAIQEVYKAIGRVAASDATVLITGESGTGKELVARAIYQHSRRADRPFLAINCGAIPESLVESELFGHEKGAFTGADRKRIGRFEQCSGGTLFLDEVGEMPLLAQVKLLRVLQEQQFERVGGTETVRTDVRLIAATNADLERRVAAGRFRSDL